MKLPESLNPVTAFVYRMLKPGGLFRLLLGGTAIGLISRVLLLIMHLLAARWLGPAEYGIFIYAIGLGMLFATLTPLGWHIAITRFLAEYQVKKQFDRMRGAVMTAEAIVWGTSIAVSLLLYSLADTVIQDTKLILGVTLGAILILPLSLRRLRRRQLLGLDKVKEGLFLDEGLTPLLVLLALLLLPLSSAVDLVIVFIVSAIFAVLVLSVKFYRYLPAEIHGVTTTYELKAWMAIALPSILAMASRELINRVDILMLGPMASLADVGEYSAAYRLSYMLSFIPVIVGSVISARIANAYYADNLGKARQVFIHALVFSAAIALPIILVLAVFPDKLVQLLFGRDFEASAQLLQVLIIGQAINALTGPVSSVLVMTGRQGAYGVAIACMGVFNIVGNYLAIPVWGAIGAAAVTTLTIALLNIWTMTIVIRHLWGQKNTASG